MSDDFEAWLRTVCKPDEWKDRTKRLGTTMAWYRKVYESARAVGFEAGARAMREEAAKVVEGVEFFSSQEGYGAIEVNKMFIDTAQEIRALPLPEMSSEGEKQ